VVEHPQTQHVDTCIIIMRYCVLLLLLLLLLLLFYICYLICVYNMKYSLLITRITQEEKKKSHTHTLIGLRSVSNSSKR
jgi:hypothetical protein